jgi:type I restriction enzyme S subunit
MNWPIKKLGDVLQISRGGSPRPIENYITEDKDGLNWIKIGDVQVGAKYITHTKEKIRKEGLTKTREVKSGDFLLSNSMSFGRPYITQIDGCIHDGWLALRDEEKIFDTDFLYHVLNSNAVKEQFIKYASGAVVKNLNIDAVSKVVVAIPPLAEQLRIAELLDTADRILKLRETAIAKLDELAQSVFVNMFGDPKSTTLWDRKEIGKLGKVYTGKTPSTSDQSNFDGDVPFVTPTDLRGVIKESTRKISHKGAETSTVVRGGSSLVGCIGDVGRVGFVSTPVAFNQQINAVVWNNELILDVYGFYVLQYMASVFMNKSVSAVVPILNKTNFSSVDIPVPSLNEQIKFVNFINSLWSLKEKMISERESDLVSSLQYQSFTVN